MRKVVDDFGRGDRHKVAELSNVVTVLGNA